MEAPKEFSSGDGLSTIAELFRYPVNESAELAPPIFFRIAATHETDAGVQCSPRGLRRSILPYRCLQWTAGPKAIRAVHSDQQKRICAIPEEAFMTHMLRKAGIALAAVLLPLAGVHAQVEYPKQQPVRIIVANTTGTGVDTLVRVLAPRLTLALGQQVYVDNRPGAGGGIGAEAAARAAPDGYTILATSTPLQVINPHLRKNLRYDPFKDFMPLAMIARTENVMIVNKDGPLHSVKDVIDFARKNPGKLKMANAGIGFQSHLANVMFTTMAGIEVLHVPYKGNSSSASVISGESDLTISPLPSSLGIVKGGIVRGIAVTGMQRTPVSPELPTMNETGVPGYSASGWTGLVLPVGTPRDVVEKLTKAITAALNDEVTKEQLLKSGGEPWLLTADAMGKFMQEELVRYGDVIRKAKITLD